MLSEQEQWFYNQITAKLESLGLTGDPAEGCALCFLEQQLVQNKPLSQFPQMYPKTLKEALRICDRFSLEPEFTTIFRLLQTPESVWQAAKPAVAECFGRGEGEVEELYNCDMDWLFVTEETVRTLSAYLRSRFDEEALIWAIFRTAALLGAPETEHRIEEVFRMLGREIGEAVIRADMCQCGWLFCRLYTDPLGAIAYMLDKGMTPEGILDMISQDSIILYKYKSLRHLPWFHDQEAIDALIRPYLPG